MAVVTAGSAPGRTRSLPVFDGVLAVAMSAYAVAATARDHDADHPWAELAAAVVLGAVALRSTRPLLMAGIAAGGLVGYAALPGSGTPLWTFLAVLVLCFSVGAHLDGRSRWAALGLLLIGGYALQLSSVDRDVPSDNTFSEVWISPLVIIGGPALAGALLRRSRRQTEEVRRLAGELEQERQRHVEEAASAERQRIARELHDVISHSVSVMVVQAGAAEQTLPEGPARAQVHAIRETGKEALAELRRQLGLLRDDQADSASPLPGLAELPALVESMGGRLTMTGMAGPLPAGLELTAYRVVQEALTNVTRHAQGAAPDVTVARHGDRLELAVSDTGGGSHGTGTGYGLRGMRERVALYGGELTAGPKPDGPGWLVRARLPLAAAST